MHTNSNQAKTYTNALGQVVPAPYYNCEPFTDADLRSDAELLQVGDGQPGGLPQEWLDGEDANYMGAPFDRSASKAWQAGWDAAQVARDQWEEMCNAAGDGWVLE